MKFNGLRFVSIVDSLSYVQTQSLCSSINLVINLIKEEHKEDDMMHLKGMMHLNVSS